MLLELAGNRENMDTATNPRARWLFPGRRAGQPLNTGTLRDQLPNAWAEPHLNEVGAQIATGGLRFSRPTSRPRVQRGLRSGVDCGR
jgi:hypothetical protein